MTSIPERPMKATKAFHKLGDISRDKPDFCLVNQEDDENYYGNWIEGFGFVQVRFPKSTTRELTVDEAEWLSHQHVQIDPFFWDNFRAKQKELIQQKIQMN